MNIFLFIFMVILDCFCTYIVYISLKNEKKQEFNKIIEVNREGNEAEKYIIISKTNELYDYKNDCFVKNFNPNCLCDKKIIEQYKGVCDYTIFPAWKKTKNFKIISLEMRNDYEG